jgi:hypothetical protein
MAFTLEERVKFDAREKAACQVLVEATTAHDLKPTPQELQDHARVHYRLTPKTGDTHPFDSKGHDPHGNPLWVEFKFHKSRFCDICKDSPHDKGKEFLCLPQLGFDQQVWAVQRHRLHEPRLQAKVVFVHDYPADRPLRQNIYTADLLDLNNVKHYCEHLLHPDAVTGEEKYYNFAFRWFTPIGGIELYRYFNTKMYPEMLRKEREKLRKKREKAGVVTRG